MLYRLQFKLSQDSPGPYKTGFLWGRLDLQQHHHDFFMFVIVTGNDLSNGILWKIFLLKLRNNKIITILNTK